MLIKKSCRVDAMQPTKTNNLCIYHNGWLLLHRPYGFLVSQRR